MTRAASLLSCYPARRQTDLRSSVNSTEAKGRGHQGQAGDIQRIRRIGTSVNPRQQSLRAGRAENKGERAYFVWLSHRKALSPERVSLPGNAQVLDPATAMRPGRTGIVRAELQPVYPKPVTKGGSSDGYRACLAGDAKGMAEMCRC